MPQLKAFKNIFIQHRWQLLLTYMLFSIEMLGTLVTPYFIAEAIHGLIQHSYHNLILLCVIRLVWMLVGVFRMRYDTRTYTNIYTSIVTKFLSQHNTAAQVSKLAAHSTLSRELVDFLEHDLVYVLEALYNIIGSLFFLYFYHPLLVGVCGIVLLPVVIISYFYGKQMQYLNQQKNDELENQVNIIAGQHLPAIQQHYRQLRHWQIRISDKQAFNFGIMEILATIVTAAALLILHHTNNLTLQSGQEVGVLLYIRNFVTGLDTIPYMGDRLSNLQDISQRIQLELEETTSLE